MHLENRLANIISLSVLLLLLLLLSEERGTPEL
jgi:hypothetical protein